MTYKNIDRHELDKDKDNNFKDSHILKDNYVEDSHKFTDKHNRISITKDYHSHTHKDTVYKRGVSINKN